MHNNRPLQNQEIRIAEHVAIACACGATVALIGVFLAPKTPGVVISCVSLMFLLMCHPVLILLPRLNRGKWLRIVGIAILAIVCVTFGAYVWPDTEPISDLTLDQAIVQQPYVVG
jgi:cytochrome bd-type quinol oxidase subunit 2